MGATSQMLIAQITDLHIGFDGPDIPDKNTERFKAVLAHISALSVTPDLLLFTGDLVESGNNWAYSRIKDLLAPIDIPQYFVMGNHDDRDAFEDIFKTGCLGSGFLNYTIEDHDLRIIVLDSLKPGYHGAEFCKTRANWLANKLKQQPSRPTLIVLHHPPIDSGIGWITASPEDPWVKRLQQTISGYDNIVQILSGHIHRNISQKFGNTLVTVSHAVAPEVALDLSPIDPAKPDDRILLTDAIGGYSLHNWNGHVLTTHCVNLTDARPIVRYDEAHSWVVRHTLDLKA